MSVPSRIFRSDIAKQAILRPHESALLQGRTITDPKALEEIEFLHKHGMTRDQYIERQRQHARLDFEANAVHDLEGEPPENICNTRGLSKQRARYARYFEWRRQFDEFFNQFMQERNIGA